MPALAALPPPSWRPDVMYVFLWGFFMDRLDNATIKTKMKELFPELGMIWNAWLDRERAKK
jgi:hypothetical protein